MYESSCVPPAWSGLNAKASYLAVATRRGGDNVRHAKTKMMPSRKILRVHIERVKKN